MAKSISRLEAALGRLNLGVSAWHNVAGKDDENGNYWTRDIGYTLLGKQWRIALRKTSGNEIYSDHNEEVWPFDEAPRWMCVESVSKIPDLFDELIKRTEETIGKLKSRSIEASELATAITRARHEAGV